MKVAIDLDDLKMFLQSVGTENIDIWGRTDHITRNVFIDFFNFLGDTSTANEIGRLPLEKIYEETPEEKARKAALDKLSTYEKQLLGIE